LDAEVATDDLADAGRLEHGMVAAGGEGRVESADQEGFPGEQEAPERLVDAQEGVGEHRRRMPSGGMNPRMFDQNLGSLSEPSFLTAALTIS